MIYLILKCPRHILVNFERQESFQAFCSTLESHDLIPNSLNNMVSINNN